MKRYHYLPFIILAGIVLFFLGRGCQPEPTQQVNVDTKAIAKRLKAQLNDRETLKLLAVKQTDTVIKWRERWHKAKHDTILIDVIALCDTVIKHDSILIVTQGDIIYKSDSIISNYQNLVRIDSCTIGQLTPRQIFFVGGDVTTNGNLYLSGGFDTKRGVFMAGYDPFNKSFKASAYLKIKAWKRRH